MNVYEIIGFLMTMLGVWLSAKEIVWGFPVAAVASACYYVVFCQSTIYLDSGLQVFFLVLSLYGWYEWLHGGKDKNELSVSRIPLSYLPYLAMVGVVATGVLGYAVVHIRSDASIPYLDAATTVTSLIAQWMLAKKYLENWLVWIVVDPIYVGMYIYKELYLTAFLYFIITLMAVQGYQHWKKAVSVA